MRENIGFLKSREVSRSIREVQAIEMVREEYILDVKAHTFPFFHPLSAPHKTQR
jgi:hypothetical protein